MAKKSGNLSSVSLCERIKSCWVNRDETQFASFGVFHDFNVLAGVTGVREDVVRVGVIRPYNRSRLDLYLRG